MSTFSYSDLGPSSLFHLPVAVVIESRILELIMLLRFSVLSGLAAQSPAAITVLVTTCW